MGLSLEKLVIGSGPKNEDLAKVGDVEYFERSFREIKALAHQIVREVGPPPFHAFFRRGGFPTENGMEYKLVLFYEKGNDAACEYALECENCLPDNWDEESLEMIRMEKERLVS